MLLGLPQQISQRSDVVAQSPSGKPRLDLLDQPAVAVWIAERDERAVAAVIGCGPGHAAVRGAEVELRPGRLRVEYLARLRTARDELVACRVDIGDDQVEVLG